MASAVGWAGVRRAKHEVPRVPDVGRPWSVASTWGNAPPCKVAKQMYSLSECRDHKKVKESTIHALSKCLEDASLRTSWDSDSGKEIVQHGSQ